MCVEISVCGGMCMRVATSMRRGGAGTPMDGRTRGRAHTHANSQFQALGHAPPEQHP